MLFQTIASPLIDSLFLTIMSAFDLWKGRCQSMHADVVQSGDQCRVLGYRQGICTVGLRKMIKCNEWICCTCLLTSMQEQNGSAIPVWSETALPFRVQSFYLGFCTPRHGRFPVWQVLDCQSRNLNHLKPVWLCLDWQILVSGVQVHQGRDRGGVTSAVCTIVSSLGKKDSRESKTTLWHTLTVWCMVHLMLHSIQCFLLSGGRGMLHMRIIYIYIICMIMLWYDYMINASNEPSWSILHYLHIT